MAALMARVRPLTAKPLIVKLTPNVSEIVPVARAAQDGGADALSLINTLRATAVDPRTGSALAGCGTGRPVRSGGASGRACADGAGGGATTAADGRNGRHPGGPRRARLHRAGASCVAVGTESFRDPTAGARVRDELRASCYGARWRTVQRPPRTRAACGPPDAPRSRSAQCSSTRDFARPVSA